MPPALAEDQVTSPFEDSLCAQTMHHQERVVADCVSGSIPSESQNGIQTPDRSPDRQASTYFIFKASLSAGSAQSHSHPDMP